MVAMKRTEAALMAAIDAVDADVWSTFNMNTDEHPSAWLEYAFDEQFPIERDLRERLCGLLAFCTTTNHEAA
jgi:hypothetical protein